MPNRTNIKHIVEYLYELARLRDQSIPEVIRAAGLSAGYLRQLKAQQFSPSIERMGELLHASGGAWADVDELNRADANPLRIAGQRWQATIQHDPQVDALEARMAPRMDAIHQRLAAIEQHTDQRLAAIEQHTDQRLTDVEQRLTDLEEGRS